MIKAIQILNDVISTTEHKLTVSSIDDLGTTYKIYVDYTYYLTLAKTFDIGGVTYTVVNFELNEWLEVTGASVPNVTEFTINPPEFIHGTPKMADAEQIANRSYPFIWLVEFAEVDYNDEFSSYVKAELDLNLFFLTDVKSEDWMVEEQYTQAIYPMLNEVEFFIKTIKKRRDLFGDLTNHKVTNHVNFGEYITNKGYDTKILTADLSGCQLKMSLPYVVDVCDQTPVPISICSPVAIYENDIFLEYVSSGGTFSYYTSNIDLDVNGVSFKTLTSNYDLTVEDTDGVQVGTLDPSNNKVIVPKGIGSLKVYYNRPQIKKLPYVQDYDEGYLYLTNFDPFYEIPQDGVYQQIDYSVDNDYLLYYNKHGHKFRLTGLNGGYYDFNDGQYKDVNGNVSTFDDEFATPVGAPSGDGLIFDHLTGLAWSARRGGFQALTTALSDVWNLTLFGYSDYFIPTLDFGLTLWRGDADLWLYPAYRPPFQFDYALLWTCTFEQNSTSNAYLLSLTRQSHTNNITTSYPRTYCRIHYQRNEYVLQP